MVIVKQAGHFFVIKIRRKYHTVGHDPSTGKTWTVVPTDGDVRIHEGWDEMTVMAVSKGRKKTTAFAYYWAALKRFKRQLMNGSGAADDRRVPN